MSGRTPHGRLAVSLAVVAALVLGGCSPNKRSATSTTSTPRTSTTRQATTTTVNAAVAVELAYRDFWDMFLELGAMTGPFDPNVVIPILRRRTTGPEYDTLFKNFQGDRLAGIVRKGTVDLAPKVLSVDDVKATLKDCYDDHIGVYRASTGERTDKDTPDRHPATVELIVEDGAWKVKTLTFEEGTCSV